MKQELSLKGKNALVTGGATGLGFGITKELRELGANVVIVGRREALLKEASQKLNVSYRCFDLSQADRIPAFVQSVDDTFGSIDILVNNAGVQNNKPALNYEYDDFIKMYNCNLFGPYLLTINIAKSMIARGGGSIVFITSAASHMGLTNNAAYSGSKGALSSLVRALASELSPKGVRVNAVAPGWIETDLVKESLRRVPERREMVERRCLISGLGTPKDIGMAVAFLASDAARYITAAELKVDGGLAVSL